MVAEGINILFLCQEDITFDLVFKDSTGEPIRQSQRVVAFLMKEDF